MKQVLAGWNLLFVGFILAYAVSELKIAFGLWRNRNDEDGEPVFGFAELAGHFFSSSLFLVIFVMGLTLLAGCVPPVFRVWIVVALIARAVGTWPLVFKYAIFPKLRK